MKNLYPKRKGKIHPSPASPSASSGGAGGQGVDALAVLKLLPAAILALTVALGYEDMEVLAYLITRSMNGPGMGGGGGGEERQRSRQVGGVHRPIFDCGCFDCYISFWSRWNCSADRERIHQVIEAFEEHLANSETKAGGCGERGRRRERRRASDRSGKRKRGKEEVKKKAAEIAEEKVLEIAAVSFSGEEKAPEGDGDERRKAEEEAAAGGERRRGWPDVLGWFKCPWWSLWSPVV